VHACTLGIPGWQDPMHGKLVDPMILRTAELIAAIKVSRLRV
jgi:hypothetical protein